MKKNTGIKWGLAGLMALVMLIGIAVMTTTALAHEADDSGRAGRWRERTFTSPLPTKTPRPEKTETPEVRETPEASETPEIEHETPEPRHTPEPEHQAPKDGKPGKDTGRDDHQDHSGQD